MQGMWKARSCNFCLTQMGALKFKFCFKIGIIQIWKDPNLTTGNLLEGSYFIKMRYIQLENSKIIPVTVKTTPKLQKLLEPLTTYTNRTYSH